MLARRSILAGGAAAIGSAIWSAGACAYEECKMIPAVGKKGCEAGIHLSKAIEAYADMNANQWCWAASIAMVFAHYGYHVEQERVVKEAYGSIVNMGAVGKTITQQLNRTWTDDNGKNFIVQIAGLYDYDSGVIGITDSQIVNALKTEQPLLFGNQQHAMVLFSVAYFPMAYGPQIFNVGFMDPLPGVGPRGPYPGEAIPMHKGGKMRYLALPKVTAA